MKTKFASALFALIFIGILSLLHSGCINGITCKQGNGIVTKQDRKVTEFSALDVSGDYEVVITQGSPAAVTVEADENLQSIIKTKVENKNLVIENTESICNSKTLKVDITTPDITDISISGVVVLKSKDTIKTNNLKIEVSGVGNIAMVVSVAKLSIDCSGTGSVTLTGKAVDMDASLSGTSDINAFKLFAENCNLSSSGAGTANVNVSKTLDVDISGTATVKYKGSPKIKQEISGVGSLEAVQ